MKFKFGEKADIAMHSRTVEKLSKAAELELFRDSLKHYYLVISGVL